MSNRVKVPIPVETELLRLSARRCCLCYGVDHDINEKEGQEAHLDKDPSNFDINNLAWMCLRHHTLYDSKTSQHKNYQIHEVKNYRNELYKEIAEKRIRLEETEIKSTNRQDYYQRFSEKYIGRDKNVKHVLDFLNNPDQHFMLLHGVGGMGKSHLLSECRERFDGPDPIHKECNHNYDLKTLFRIGNIPYPEELTEVNAIQQCFLDEFCDRDITLILDDFYEIIDKDVRDLLPKFTKISKGKILLISRIIPKELTQTGWHVNSYEIPPLDKEDFKTVIQNYIQSEGKIVTIPDQDLNKIYNKAQGYPLGGQLIVDLLDMEEKLDDILKDLPKFQAKRDPEGIEFSGRLLDNIFKKGSRHEIDLLCEFSTLYEASSIDVVKQLPSYDFNAFEALVKRRRFIQKEADGSFHCHAMIKDFAYEELSDKKAVHDIIGKYYEKILFQNTSLNSEILFKTINHYKRIDISKLKSFGRKINEKYKIANVKSLIEDSVEDTIRNYESLLLVYPEKVAYWNQLGMAYREHNQKQLAIDTFRKALEIDSKAVPSYNELGITYREHNQKQLAIDTFRKVIEGIDPKHAPSYNELGITYRENNQIQLAIDTFLKACEMGNIHSFNELGILYREIGEKQLAIKYLEEACEMGNIHSFNELGILYREIREKQLAIATFLKGLKVEPENVRILNELGITYRENNQFEEAIATFLKVIEEVNPNHVPSYNELGITYRENNQFGEAIQIIEKALGINPKEKRLLLNLMQIFLFFQPDKTKAKVFYDKLNVIRPAHPSFKNHRKNYEVSIENLDSIWKLTVGEFKIYNKYVFIAIQYKAYHTVLSLLFELNQKYPGNSKIISQLGRTLSNRIICRRKEGREFLKEAIELFEREHNEKQLIGHVFFYLYNLLNDEEFKLLDKEIELFKNKIEHLPKFFRFLGKYYGQLGKPEEEIIEVFEKAIKISLSNDEKNWSVSALLNYLTNRDSDKYKMRIEQLKENTRQLSPASNN
ncbi:MAG: hypothetical protein COA57_09450 [Flavobacteriales bacterium]|nr:MAG: hypothetical protein COA57_09450 [Flavobacteriales bacterium]